MKAKNKNVCVDCIDEKCIFKEEESVKRNCPADCIPPIEAQMPYNRSPRYKIKNKASERIAKILPACAACDAFMMSCVGRTQVEWKKITEEDVKSQTEVADGFCIEILHHEYFND